MAQRAVLVTGASTGIGRATTLRMAAAGWTVFAGVRRAEDGEALAADASAGAAAGTAGTVRPLPLDVTEPEQVEAAVTHIEAEAGGLFGVVNNAGIGVGGPVELVTDDEWRRQFDVNLFGALDVTRRTFPLVLAQRGRFVYMGSIGGRLSAPMLAPYSATKHALEAVAESMRHELAGLGVAVALIEPGEVRTPIFDKADDALAEIERTIPIAARARYQRFLFAVRGFTAEGRSRGVDPDRVAVAVEHALTARRPKPRYLVGPDAKLAGHGLTRLPDRWRDRLVALDTRRLERAGRARLGAGSG